VPRRASVVTVRAQRRGLLSSPAPEFRYAQAGTRDALDRATAWPRGERRFTGLFRVPRMREAIAAARRLRRACREPRVARSHCLRLRGSTALPSGCSDVRASDWGVRVRRAASPCWRPRSVARLSRRCCAQSDRERRSLAVGVGRSGRTRLTASRRQCGPRIDRPRQCVLKPGVAHVGPSRGRSTG